MWKLALTLICAKSVLSADFNRLSQQNEPDFYPIDYNDDFQKDYRAGKPQNLIFKFAQIRRDQPPQVEDRNEDLGRYMYRKKVTTTEAPPVEKHHNIDPLSVDDFSVDKSSFSKVDYHRRYPEINTWHSHPTTLPPATSTSKWEAAKVEDEPQRQPSTSWHPRVYEQPRSEAEIYSTSLPLYVPEVKLSPIIVAPAPSMIEYPSAHENRRQQKSRQPTRGNIRYKPYDVIPKEATTSTTTVTSVPQSSPVEAVAPKKSMVFSPAESTRAPPPAVPTLSPWYDGFGK